MIARALFLPPRRSSSRAERTVTAIQALLVVELPPPALCGGTDRGVRRAGAGAAAAPGRGCDGAARKRGPRDDDIDNARLRSAREAAPSNVARELGG